MRCKGGWFRKKLCSSRCSSCIEGGRQIDFFPYLSITDALQAGGLPAFGGPGFGRGGAGANGRKDDQ